MTPEWLNHLSVKSTLYTLNTHSQGPNFTPFRSTTSVFEIQVFRKSEMHLMTPEWRYSLVKSTLCTLHNHPWGPNFNPFRSTTSHFRAAGLSKIGMQRMTPEWPYSRKCQKYPVYTEYSPPRPKFQSVSLYDQIFSRSRLVENRNVPNGPRKPLIT